MTEARRRQPRRVVFLDRDGVINVKAPEGSYVRDWAEFAFLPGAPEALARLSATGAALFVVTNQRGVARGLVRGADLEAIHEQMAAALAVAGAPISGIYVCPHEADACDCRKPGVDLFMQARRDHPWISFHDADLIGDSLSDLEAGHRLGMRLWLVGQAERRRATVAAARERGMEIADEAGSLIELVSRGPLLGEALPKVR